MTELAWRPVNSPDAAGLAELFQAVEQSAPLGLETDLAEVGARLFMPQLDLTADTLAGVDAAGRLLAYAEAADMGVGQGQGRIRLTSVVHPDMSDDVIGRLLDWLVSRARSLLRERHPGLPGVLGARCAAADRTRLALLTQAGFKVVNWHQDMVRGLAEPVPSSPQPQRMAIIGYDPHYEEAARIAHNDAYADDPGALLPDAATWPQHATGLATFRPDASFLALAGTSAGQEIAGFLFSLERRHDTGASEGSLHCLGIRRPWRRQGLATVLISRALAAYRTADFTNATLEVDSTNTAARALYRRLGFTDSGRGYAMLQGPAS